MNDPVNPYAVSDPDADTLEPIYFSGTLTRDDLRVSLLNAPPPTRRQRIMTFVWIAILAASALVLWQARVQGQQISAVLIFGVPCFILGPWVKLLNFWMPANLARARRAEIAATRQTLGCGWMDENHFVTTDRHSTLLASWDYFGPVYIFPTHLLIPTAADQSRRIALPWQFFDSPGDVRRVCSFLRSRMGAAVDRAPDNPTLASIMSDSDGVVFSDADANRKLSGENWPFETDPVAESSFVVDLMGGATGFRVLLSTLAAIAIGVFGYLLPIWVAGAVWLFQPVLPGQPPFEDSLAVFVICAVAALAAFILFAIVRATLRTRRVQKHPFRIAIRDAGVHISHEAFRSWFRWSSVMGVIADKKAAGWIIQETEEEIRIPKACFDTADQFESFKKAITNHFQAAATGKTTRSN